MKHMHMKWVIAAVAAAGLGLAGCDDVAEDPLAGEGGTGGGDFTIAELGTVDATTEDEVNGVFYAETTVTIPDGAKGANIIAMLPGSAGADTLVMIDRVARGDTVVHDYWANGTGPQRGEPIEGVFTLQYPTSEQVDFATGEHTIRVAADSAQSGVKLYGIYKTDGSTSAGKLDFHLYLAGIEGLDASNALQNEKFAAMWAEATRLLAKAGIEPGAITLHDVADAGLHEVTGPSSAAGTDLGNLFSLSGANPGNQVHLFFVKRLSQESGDPLLGISGGVPGPGGKGGTPHSGIVANAETLFEVIPDGADDRNFGPKLVAQIAVHETFHYLGLNHTSERDASGHDPIADTAECTIEAHDANTNGAVSTAECAAVDSTNLMFWAGVDYSKLPAEADVVVSGGQKYVLLRNPLTK